jgi:superfamily II DNA/RNA helicase
LREPEEITVHKEAVSTENIEQFVYNIASSNRRKLLQYLVKQKEYKSIIIFVKTKDETEFILEYIKLARVSVNSIHR